MPGLFGLAIWQVLALGLLGGIVSIGLVFAMLVAARRSARDTGPLPDTLVFRYLPGVRWGCFGMVTCFLGGIAIARAANPPQSAEPAVIPLLIYAALVVGFGAAVWELFRYRLAVGPDGLERRSGWRRRRVIRWEDITSVSFIGPMGSGFEVRAIEGRSIWLPVEVGGLELFLEACERRLTPNQLEPAAQAYVFLDRPFPER